MQVRVISDVHLEHRLCEYAGEDEIMACFNKICPSRSDDDKTVLILAGDISSYLTHIEALYRWLVIRFEAVIHVAGNHEYYGSTIFVRDRELSSLSAHYGVYYAGMIPRLNTIAGQKFFYGTMWTEISPTAASIQYGDSSAIEDFAVERITTIHKQFKASLISEIQQGDDLVVVTHHAPSWQALGGNFQPAAGLNEYFVTNMDYFMGHPIKFWFHGHCHDTFEKELGGTMVARYPVGYPSMVGEAAKFEALEEVSLWEI